MPSTRADAVRFPRVLASVSSTRSRSTSLTSEPTSHRVRRRREVSDIGESGDGRSMRDTPLYERTILYPAPDDKNEVNDFLMGSLDLEVGNWPAVVPPPHS